MGDLIYNLKLATNFDVGDNIVNIYITIINGITIKQAEEIDNLCRNYICDYKEENNLDYDEEDNGYDNEEYNDNYEELDYYEMIEKVLGSLGIKFSYPKVDYTIYL